MKLTNTYNLPDTLVNALSWASRKPSEGFSVTGLISPPRIAELTRRHWDEIEADISDMIWLAFGTAVHAVLERGELPESLVEERLSVMRNGVMVRGKADLLYQRILDDWKVTSVWTLIYNPDGREDWEAQLNLYRWLYHMQGFDDIEKLRIIAILRDHSKSKAKRENDYPPIPIATINIPMWTLAETEAYLDSRIQLHLSARGLPDDQLPMCSDKDCWAKPTEYAIMKRGNKRAVKLYDSEEEAKAHLPIGGHYIEERKGEKTRCEEYCNAQPFCNQFKAEP